MALPVLQEALEHLNAGRHHRSDAVARLGDVVSFPLAKIINFVDEAVRREDARRLLFVEANRSLTEALVHPDELQPDDLDEYAAILVQMKRARHDFSRPLFDRLEGASSFKSIAETLRSHPAPHPADSRLARRQAERIDECAAACEAQRVQFLALTGRVVALMEANVAGDLAFAQAFKTAISRQSIDRYPVINDYLAS